MDSKKETRRRLINWQLHQLTLPRFQMSIIILLTGLIGFFSSFLLLHSGITQMWIRYPLSILLAYGVFLLLLRLWLAFQRTQNTLNIDTKLDIPFDFSISPNSDFNFGGGGDFSGGGAGGSWGNSVSSSSSGGDSFLNGISFDLDLEEIGLLILAFIALIGGMFATIYVIYIAPFLLAEILVDGLLLRSLQKRFKNIERKHWLQTAMKQTLLSAILCAFFFGVAGGVFQKVFPEAKSMGEVWSAIIKKSD